MHSLPHPRRPSTHTHTLTHCQQEHAHIKLTTANEGKKKPEKDGEIVRENCYLICVSAEHFCSCCCSSSCCKTFCPAHALNFNTSINLGAHRYSWRALVLVSKCTLHWGRRESFGFLQNSYAHLFYSQPAPQVAAYASRCSTSSSSSSFAYLLHNFRPPAATSSFFSWLKRSVKATRAAILSHEFITRGQETKGPQNFHMHNEDFSHRQSACPNSSARPPSFRSD